MSATLKPRLLDYPEAADYLGTTERHVRRLRDEHRLPATKIGGKVRFDTRQLDRYIERHTEAVR